MTTRARIRAGLAVLGLTGLLAGPVASESSAYAKAMAAYQDRRLDEALQQAQEAVHQEPGHVDARVLLGELYYLRQELSQAEAQWEQALTLAPSRTDVRQQLEQLKKEMPLERAMARSDTYPFIVRLAEGQTPAEFGDLRLLLRDAYRFIGQSFDYFPDHPIPVILYPEREFQQVRGLSHQVAGFYDGKIRLPLRPGLRTGQDLQRIFWHEYTHAIVHDLAKGRCPMWLNEGIATLQEARVRAPDLTRAREALRAGQRGVVYRLAPKGTFGEAERVGALDSAPGAGRLVPWHQLWQEEQYHLADQAATELRYQEGYLIARYLVRRGQWRQLVGLLTRLSRGSPIEDALRAEYHVEPAQLEQEWLGWLRREGV